MLQLSPDGVQVGQPRQGLQLLVDRRAAKFRNRQILLWASFASRVAAMDSIFQKLDLDGFVLKLSNLSEIELNLIDFIKLVITSLIKKNQAEKQSFSTQPPARSCSSICCVGLSLPLLFPAPLVHARLALSLGPFGLLLHPPPPIILLALRQLRLYGKYLQVTVCLPLIQHSFT